MKENSGKKKIPKEFLYRQPQKKKKNCELLSFVKLVGSQIFSTNFWLNKHSVMTLNMFYFNNEQLWIYKARFLF